MHYPQSSLVVITQLKMQNGLRKKGIIEGECRGRADWIRKTGNASDGAAAVRSKVKKDMEKAS